jgi:ankyrin repeat protein
MTQTEFDNALLEAAFNNDAVAVSDALDKGADINAQNDLKMSALNWAAFHGNVTLVTFLVNKGADINHPNDVRRTPLIEAVYKQRVTTVQTLLSLGADPDIRGNDDGTALRDAVNAPSQNAEGIPILNMLLKAGANLNIGDASGRTALMRAASFKNGRMIEMLLKAGADPNLKDSDGLTALMHTILSVPVLEGCKEMMRLLILAGADIHLRDNKGRSALDLASRDYMPTETAKFLRAQETDFRKGLDRPVRAPKPLRLKP